MREGGREGVREWREREKVHACERACMHLCACEYECAE